MASSLRQQGDLATLDNSKLKQVDDFYYLGARLVQTKKDLEILKAKAWAAQQANSGVEIQPQQRSEHTFL